MRSLLNNVEQGQHSKLIDLIQHEQRINWGKTAKTLANLASFTPHISRRYFVVSMTVFYVGMRRFIGGIVSRS